MHEVTLCQNALDIIEQQAKQSGAQRVTAVWLELSAVSCIE
ncbi:hydrogenase/urease maturation nickel metallochaperone HypA, partial [Klebsiella pneumoniae]